jgi:glycosyltransferase involved in cell wall biosynthesis
MASPVMHVVHSLNLGGAERLAAQIATTLSDEFDIFVACIDEAGLWAPDVRRGGVPVYEIGRQPGIDIVVAARLAALAHRNGVRLIHAHQYTPYFYSVLARVLSPRVRLLFHEHGRHYPEIDSPKRIAVNSHVFQRLTSRVVAVSEECRERVVRYEGFTRDSIKVVYNGVMSPPPADRATRDAIRLQLGLDPGDIVTGTVGRLDPVKNVPLAIASLASLLPDFPRLRLLVIGDGPARAEIEAAAEEHGVTDEVVMTGFRADAAELVRAMDIFLLPSLTEGTSLALVGAMAAGVPAVATSVGGTPEVLEHGRTGLLVESRDQDALTAAIRELIEAPDRARSMGEAARQVYLDRFTFEGMIERFRAIYRELLA